MQSKSRELPSSNRAASPYLLPLPVLTPLGVVDLGTSLRDSELTQGLLSRILDEGGSRLNKGEKEEETQEEPAR